MLIHSTMLSRDANGPGHRAVVWFQGCRLKCPGCFNPETHSFGGGWRATASALFRELLPGTGLTGLTISGGEPMHQPSGLRDFLRLVNRRRPDWMVGMFTGYTQPELDAGRYWTIGMAQDSYNELLRARIWREIQKCLDWAVMGRFDSARKTAQGLVASANQQVVYFSSRDPQAGE